MTDSQQTTPPNEAQPQLFPPLTLRVGVTGARNLPADRLQFIHAEVDIILRLIRQKLEQLAADPKAARLYRRDDGQAVSIDLRIVSALAQGADCLVAEEALKAGERLKFGYKLFAPIPFPILEYEKTFTAGPESIETFRCLASQGHLLELDGARGKDEDSSYEAVGQFVIANCDLLIAIWDGEPAHGRGGTAQIVEFAATKTDVPIWWIDFQKKSAQFIANARDWSRRDIATTDKSNSALFDYLAKVLLPPDTSYHPRPGVPGWAIDHVCDLCNHIPHPLRVYREEKIPPTDRFIWNTYSLLLKIIAASPSRDTALAPKMAKAETQVEIFWEKHYRRADGLSIAYAKRYRSSYVLIIFLALLAFVFANTSHLFIPFIAKLLVGKVPESIEFWICTHASIALGKTLLELIPLLGVSVLAGKNLFSRWQDRWIDYRLLAELCRKQMILSPLGLTLPGTEINDIAQDERTEDDTRLPRELWVGRYFLALMRSAPYPETDLKLNKQRAFTLGSGLIDEQSIYHRHREIQMKKAEDRFLFLGDAAFFITLIVLLVFSVRIAVLKNSNFLEGTQEWIELAALTLSGLSATFVALRAYAEFALIARQSRRMRNIMKEMSEEMADLDLSRPLSSLTLGTTLQRLAVLMMQEIGGWAQLFRLKSIEMH